MWLLSRGKKRHKHRDSHRRDTRPLDGIWVPLPNDDAPAAEVSLPKESGAQTTVTLTTGSVTLTDMVRALRLEQAATERERQRVVQLEQKVTELQNQVESLLEELGAALEQARPSNKSPQTGTAKQRHPRK